jgi:homocysteine S-methyltransferase
MLVRLDETYSQTMPVTRERRALRVFGVSRSLPDRGFARRTATPGGCRPEQTVTRGLGGSKKSPYSGRVKLAGKFAWPSESVLLDGGLATELEARGHDLSDSLWSAKLLRNNPQAIAEVHAGYFRAGATVATTASYQASFEGFSSHGIGRDEAAGLLRRSVDLARKARDDAATEDLVVAASIGPYGAALADGSEYRGCYGLSVAELERWHRPRLEIVAAAGADVLACETVPDVDEAEALVNLVRSVGVPAWLSYTVDGTRTRARQPLAEAFAVAAGVDEIVAIGVNCCAPEDVLPAIGIALDVGKPVIVYPNSGERWDSRRRRWAGQSRFSARLAREWAAAGARVIGGCCRVGPADIAAVATNR